MVYSEFSKAKNVCVTLNITISFVGIYSGRKSQQCISTPVNAQLQSHLAIAVFSSTRYSCFKATSILFCTHSKNILCSITDCGWCSISLPRYSIYISISLSQGVFAGSAVGQALDVKKHLTLRNTELIHFLWPQNIKFSGSLVRPSISPDVADGTVFAWVY